MNHPVDTLIQDKASPSWKNPRLVGRIRELDGVRGLAILLVLIWHYLAVPAQVSDRSWQAYILALFRLSWSGVDLFFVLSGFLIGGILLDAKYSPKYYQTFYGRRFCRIFPLYYIWVLMFAVGLYAVRPDSPAAFRAIFVSPLPAWSYPLFIQNIFVAAHETFGPTWMIATWSLAVEEQFYLLLPLAIRHLSSRGVLNLACMAIVVAPIVRVGFYLSGNPYYAPYTLLPCRMDALGFGVLLAVVLRSEQAWTWLAAHRKHLYGVFLALAIGMVGLTVHSSTKIMAVVGYSWIAAFYASLLLLAIVEPRRLERLVLRSSPLVNLGTISYAVYVLHQGVEALFHYVWFGRTPLLDGWAAAGVSALALCAVILIAAMSWKALETPLLRYAHGRFRYELASDKSLTTMSVR